MSFGQFQFRRGTAATWTSANPTLLSGEFGLETDTSQFKIGDGATAWNSLAYGGVSGQGVPTGGTANQALTKINGTNYNTQWSTINPAFVGSPSGSGTSSGTNTGDVTLNAVGSSPNANGASLSGQSLTLQPSSSSQPGLMTAAQFTKLSGLVTGLNGWIDVTQQPSPVTTGNSGATNNTNLAAIMTAAGSGSVLYFPPGWYTFASTITIPNKVFVFQGARSGLNGNLSAFTWTTNNAADWITQTSADYYMAFRDLGFIAQAAQTAGAVINVNGNANNDITDCTFTGLSSSLTLFNCINFNGSNGGEETVVSNCDFTNFTGTAIICNSNLETVVIDSITVNGGQIGACGVNVHIGGAIQLDNCDIIGCTNNLLIDPVVSTVVASVFVANTYFDSSQGSCIKITGAGATVRCKFNQCSFTTAASASPNNAVEVSSTFAYGVAGMGLEFINCNVLNTFGSLGSGTGFNITGAGDFRIAQCNIAAWGTGIAVTPANAAGMTRPQIVGNTIGNTGNYGINTTGINLSAGSFAYGVVQISGNVFGGNTTNLTDNSGMGTGTAATGQKLITSNTGTIVTAPPANYAATAIPLTTVTNVDSRGGMLIPTGTGTRPCSIRITVYATNSATVQTLTATVRYGTNNSNADAAVQTQAFTAGTAAAGSGLFVFDIDIPTSTTLASSTKFFNGNNAATGIAGNISLFSSLSTLATIATSANNWLGVYFSSATAAAITIRSVKYEILSQ